MKREYNRKIILIGGAPTVGKSTVAELIAKKLNIPWISTDQIRQIMRATVKRENMPDLFNPEGYTAETFLTKFSAEEIVEIEMKQGDATWIGIKKIIDDDFTWKNGFIIEGVNILPHLVKKDFGEDKNIKTIFLIDENADKIRHVIFNRGLWDDAHTYPDYIKEKEIEWVLLFNKKIRMEAEKYDYPFIEVTKNLNDIEKIIKILEL